MNREPGLKLFSKQRRSNPEAALQRAVCEHLRLRGTDGMLYLKIANEGKRSPAYGLEMKRQGLKPGAADLLIIVNGNPVFLELKAKGEKPTAAQFDFGTDAINAGADWHWVDNINSALNILEHIGAIKPQGNKRAA
jgi:hypothetical protein